MEMDINETGNIGMKDETRGTGTNGETRGTGTNDETKGTGTNNETRGNRDKWSVGDVTEIGWLWKGKGIAEGGRE